MEQTFTLYFIDCALSFLDVEILASSTLGRHFRMEFVKTVWYLHNTSYNISQQFYYQWISLILLL